MVPDHDLPVAVGVLGEESVQIFSYRCRLGSAVAKNHAASEQLKIWRADFMTSKAGRLLNCRCERGVAASFADDVFGCIQ
jgi:hypothetical protein